MEIYWGGSTSQWSKWRFLIIYEEALSEYYIHDYYCLCGAYEKKSRKVAWQHHHHRISALKAANWRLIVAHRDVK